MANGFTASERLDHTAVDVWAYLVDPSNATQWMRGVDEVKPDTPGPLQVGTCLSFTSRGKTRESRVTDLIPCERLALTSTQGGVTATYTYTLAADGDGTRLTLEATCSATGLWRLLHPLIVFAMKQSDASQLSSLKAAMDRRS